MMTDRESLLSAVAKRHAYSLEDAVTDALSFILSTGRLPEKRCRSS